MDRYIGRDTFIYFFYSILELVPIFIYNMEKSGHEHIRQNVQIGFFYRLGTT